MQTDAPILLFDGVCNLCNRSVQWVLKRDKPGVFRFAALQSEVGKALLAQANLPVDALDTIVLIHRGRAFVRSDAALEVARLLGIPWSFALLFKGVPRPWRNALYDWVARNRYRWFGQEETCWLPDPIWKNRFL
jgi:predicted DCC family thiol-disulfide oxidoreductase YuxK